MKLYYLLLLSILLSFKTLASDSTKLKNVYSFSTNAHFSNPRNLLSRSMTTPDTIRWECQFDKSCYYFIKDKNGKMDIDQWDYNKLTGMAFNPLNPMDNTAMIGWRHNPKTQLIELVPYWHVQKKRFFEDKFFISVRPDEPFTVEMVTNKIKKTVEIKIKTQKGNLRDAKIFSSIPSKSTLINPYFGGTSRAPCNMHLFLKRVK